MRCSVWVGRPNPLHLTVWSRGELIYSVNRDGLLGECVLAVHSQSFFSEAKTTNIYIDIHPRTHVCMHTHTNTSTHNSSCQFAHHYRVFVCVCLCLCVCVWLLVRANVCLCRVCDVSLSPLCVLETILTILFCQCLQWAN